jgi:hypothetical protein
MDKMKTIQRPPSFQWIFDVFFIIYYPKWNHDLIIGQINLVETQMQIKGDDT